MKLKVTVLGGEAHAGNSNETAFRIAASDAFKKGLQEGGPVLLEPIMRLDITTPEEYLGDFVGDLQQRRALIARTEIPRPRHGDRSPRPAEGTVRLLQRMRSLSQGRAGCSIEPFCYSPAPPGR